MVNVARATAYASHETLMQMFMERAVCLRRGAAIGAVTGGSGGVTELVIW